MLALVHPFDPSPEHHTRKIPRLPSFTKQQSKSISFAKPYAIPQSTQASSSSSSQHHHHHPEQSPAPASSEPISPQQHHQLPLDINSYPPTDLLKVLASLLTQIAATNDKLESASGTPENQSGHSLPHATPIWHTLTTASKNALLTPSSTLTFHARNVPTITLEAYLLRILKYCPTSNQVFLSLLVYFDRMSKLSSEAIGRTFVIDSYNIHRLVIAGVTVASKFFSDVFYTNSRYAKVGGLPQAELNQLELQFLLLNDFRLVISPDEMQRYAEQLILFAHGDNPTAAPISSHSSQPSPLSTPTHAKPVTSPSSTHISRVPQGAVAMGAIDAYGGRIPDDRVAAYRSHSQPEVSKYQPHSQSSAYYSNSTHSSSHHLPWSASSSSSASHYSAPNVNNGGHNKTPHARPRVHLNRQDGDDDDTETETETDVAEGDDTTDDEPTIRPAHSSAGSSCANSDTQSLHSVSTDEGDTGDEGGDEHDVGDGEDDEGIGRGRSKPAREGGGGGMKGEGDATPERRLFVVGRSPKDRDIVAHHMGSP